MKYNVMFNILMLLLRKKKVTAAELAERYEVSIRSIYRYIDELAVCGVPIDATRGINGGIKIADTYRLPSGFFTKDEYAVTLNALDAMASQISDENLHSAKRKLISTQKNGERDLSVCGNIIVDGGTWGDSDKFSEKMMIFERAVNENESVFIDYYSREGEHSKRVIDPYVLIFKQNIWYVWAFCHNKLTFRTFKIGRVKSASLTGKKFDKKPFTREDIDLDFHYRDDELTEVTFEIEKASLADAEEWLGIDNVEAHGKSFIATVSLPDDDILVNKILSYGGNIKVLNPPELKEKVKKTAAKIAGII